MPWLCYLHLPLTYPVTFSFPFLAYCKTGRSDPAPFSLLLGSRSRKPRSETNHALCLTPPRSQAGIAAHFSGHSADSIPRSQNHNLRSLGLARRGIYYRLVKHLFICITFLHSNAGCWVLSDLCTVEVVCSEVLQRANMSSRIQLEQFGGSLLDSTVVWELFIISPNIN